MAEEMQIRDEAAEIPRCDRPGCTDAPVDFYIRPNPSCAAWGSLTGGDMPVPATPLPVVKRCRKHLHEEGHFTRDEYTAASEVLEFFARDFTRRSREASTAEQAEAIKRDAECFQFVLSLIRYKYGY